MVRAGWFLREMQRIARTPTPTYTCEHCGLDMFTAVVNIMSPQARDARSRATAAGPSDCLSELLSRFGHLPLRTLSHERRARR